jgi:hypothetical protein
VIDKFGLSFFLGQLTRRFILTVCDNAGHGGSDGLHGYVESLDQVVLDTVSGMI